MVAKSRRHPESILLILQISAASGIHSCNVLVSIAIGDVDQVSLGLWLDGEWLHIAGCHLTSTQSLLQPTLLLFLECS